MRAKRPHCFTIRELLILAARVEKAQRVAYLEKVFGWFFERTRSTGVAFGGGAIAVSVAVSTAIASEEILTIVIAALAAAWLVGIAVWINYVLAPLHREYLDCLALLNGIGDFEHELRARLVSTGPPESEVYVIWCRRTGWWASKAVARELRTRVCRWKVRDEELPSDAIGRYLVEILAQVPTDQYERHAQVRQVVDHCLNCASRAKAAADSPLPESEAWKEILVEKPRTS